MTSFSAERRPLTIPAHSRLQRSTGVASVENGKKPLFEVVGQAVAEVVGVVPAVDVLEAVGGVDVAVDVAVATVFGDGRFDVVGDILVPA